MFYGDTQRLADAKFLQSTISSSESIIIPTNNKIDKSVRYIYDNKLWERWYVFLKIIFPCLRVLRLADSNHAEMDKFYYYSRITRQCIVKKYLIFIIGNHSQTYHHQPIYGTCLTTKVMKKSHHQMITLDLHTIYVLSYKSCGMKDRNISILIMLWLVGCYV